MRVTGAITGTGGLTVTGGNTPNFTGLGANSPNPYVLVIDSTGNSYSGNTTINNATVVCDTSVPNPPVNTLSPTVLTLSNSAVFALRFPAPRRL